MQFFVILFAVAFILAGVYSCGVYNSDKEYQLKQSKIEQHQAYEQHRHEEAMKPNNSKMDKVLKWMTK